MTILLFLVDTSASMAQKNYMGVSGLDTAKSLVADLIKQRQRDVHARQFDRYMLLSTEEFPLNVKTGFREGNAVLTEQLKGLRPCGRHPLKQGIISAFQFVNMSRAASGLDNYGHGRFPTYQEPAVIITISDANSMSDLPADFELHGKMRTAADTAVNRPPAPGVELTEEMFRWDQRMFSIVLRMGARAPPEPRIRAVSQLATDESVVQKVCASTGGRSYAMTSHKQQSTLVEQLIASIQQNGVILRFEFPAPGVMPRNGHLENGDITEERKADVASENLRSSLETKPMTLVYTRNRAQGHWPIPEAFWPENVQAGSMLPPRKAHPLVTIGITEKEAMVNTEFPFDKYEIEPGPLTDFVKERTSATGNVNICWQVFVANSCRLPGLGKPFGYLKTATNGTNVNLFIMPYNYPTLLKLLDDQKADIRIRQNPDWRRKLDKYIEDCPGYYKQHVKKALVRLKLTGGILDEPGSVIYLPPILSYLNKCKHIGKEEFEAKCGDIAIRLRQPPKTASYIVPVEKKSRQVTEQKNFRIDFVERASKKKEDAEKKEKKRGTRAMPIPQQTRPSSPFGEEDAPPDPEQTDGQSSALGESHSTFALDLGTAAPLDSVYRNPFNIHRSEIVQMLPRLRVNLEQQLSDSKIPALEGGLPGTQCKLQTAYDLHSLPVGQMGNYDEYVKSLEAIGKGPMREVEPRAVREHAFGNPFKKDKKSMAIDEVGEAAIPSTSKDNNGMTRKDRKALNEGGRPPRRKAGPLATDSMQKWRERRRTASTCSSVVSDISHTSEDLSEELKEVEENGEEDVMEVEDLSSLSMGNGGEEGQTTVSTPSSNGDSGISEWGLDEEADEDEDEPDLIIEEVISPVKKRPKLDDEAEIIPVKNHANVEEEVKTEENGGSEEGMKKEGKRQRESGDTSIERSPLDLDVMRQLKGEVCSIIRRIKTDDYILSELDASFLTLPLSSRQIIIRYARDESRRFKKRTLTEGLQKRLDKLEGMNGLL